MKRKVRWDPMSLNERRFLILTASLVMAAASLSGILGDWNGTADPSPSDIPPSGSMRFKLEVPHTTFITSRLSDRLWTIPVLEGAIYPPTDGEPSVPVLVKRLEIRNEVKEISLVRSGPKKVRLEAPIPPSYGAQVIGSEAWELGTGNELEMDEGSYASHGPYPEMSVAWTHLGYGWEDGERSSIYSVTYAPMDYDPAASELTLYTELELVVYEDDQSSVLYSRARYDHPSGYIPGTELLVIAHDPFMDDLNDLIEWKKETGKTLTVVGYSTVNSAYPALDGPASIWTYIRDAYFGDGRTLRWVLLAGEPRFVPTRMVYDLDPYQGEPQYLPADTYYSCLDGPYTNWDQDGDGRWGELGDITDVIPEVYVSRISLDTEAEAQGWARKVVNYEKNPPAGGWSSTAAFFGSTTHFPDDGPTESEDLWDIYLDNVHANVDRYYSPGPTQQTTGAKLLNYGNIQEGLTSGFSTLNYMGHGHYALWSEGTQNDNTIIYTVNEASSLANGAKLPLIFAMSCETNWFDDASFDSISEEFTENPSGGAIAYLGAVRTTEGGIGFSPHQYTPGAPGIQEDVLRMIAGGKRSMAEILLEAKEYYYTQWSSYFYYYQFAYNAWVEHSILGPPDTEVWTAVPKVLNVVHSHENDRYSNFTVSVTDGGGKAVPDAVVCIRSQALDRTASAVTDKEGRAKVPFEITGTANGKITVTRSGYRPFQASLILTDNTPPTVRLDRLLPYPDGASGWYVSDPGLYFTPSEPCEVRYRWNDEEDQRYTGTLQAPMGENKLEHWGIDTAGNVGTKVQTKIAFDPEPPMVAFAVTPPIPDGRSGWYISRPVVEVSLSGPVGSEQRVEWWLDRSVKQLYGGPIHIPDGEHELHIQASDKAGNRADQLDLAFKVDTDVPVTTLSTGGVERNGNGFFVEPMTITLRTEDRSAKIYFKWDAEEDWSQYNNPISPPSGKHILHYRSEDAHGNKETVRTEQVNYDIVPPVLRYTINPQQPSGSNGWYTRAPTISLTGEDDNGNYSIKYRFQGGVETVYERPVTAPEGISTFKAAIIDEAGNQGELQELVLKVDTVPERTSLATDASPDQSGWYLDLPMITLRTQGKAAIYYRFLGYGDFQKYGGAILPPSEEGSFQLEYYSVDDAGNRETVRTFYLSVDAKGPLVNVEGPRSGKVGEALRFDMSSSTDGIGITGYYFDPGDGSKGEWTDSPLFSHSYKEGGTYTLRFKAKDALGHESEPLELKVTVTSDDKLTYIIIGGGAGLLLLLGGAALLAVIARRHHAPPQHHTQHLGRSPHPHPGLATKPHGGVPRSIPSGTKWTHGYPQGFVQGQPGPMQGYLKSGVQLGSGRTTPLQQKMDGFIDKPINDLKGKTNQSSSPLSGVKQRPFDPRAKQHGVPEPPKPPTF